MLAVSAVLILLPGILGLINHYALLFAEAFSPNLTPYVQQTTNTVHAAIGAVTQWLGGAQG